MTTTEPNSPLGQDGSVVRPQRFDPAPVPDIPDAAGCLDPSTEYSHFRTGLSRHRTGLSEHRTDLSEFRTDLSQHRTQLSDHRTEMSMRRTGMSFHRTRLSSDRTMMSEIRTALSLIGFGFTLYQVFDTFHEAGAISNAGAPRNFGAALIVFGILILAGGIFRHIQFMRELRIIRRDMADEHLIHAQTLFPVSIPLIVAMGLLLLGVLAILTIVFNVSLLG